MHLPAFSILIGLAALPASTAALSWPTSDASSSELLNGVPVELAFQHQLQKDLAALGWNTTNPVGSEPDLDDHLAADLDLDESAILAAGHPSEGHHARMRRAAKKKVAAVPKYQNGRKVRGVNIGSWLVTEPWMVPSIYVPAFKSKPKTPILDEYTLCKYMGRSWCTKTLTAHYKSFITEQDFADIAAAGLNHVRIPVGYWALDISAGEPYTQGQLPFLQKGVLWAKKHGLSVIVDIHGLPDSQNGYDNSGRRGSIGWLNKSSNIKRSEAVLKALVAEFTKSAYGGIVSFYAPANEPRVKTSSSLTAKLKGFYTDSYALISAKTGAAWFLGHEAYLGLPYWNSFLPGKKFAVDRHIYSVFSDDQAQYTAAQRRAFYCSRKADFANSAKYHVSLTGEWTPASNDCGQELPGLTYTAANQDVLPGMLSRTRRLLGDAACANKTRSGSTFSQAYKNELRMWFDAQADVYEDNSQGWIVWAWKLEDGAADDWSYQAGLKYGWIPKDPTERKYPNQCK